MQIELPFNPVELVLQGVLQGLQMLAVVLWSLPLWAKAVLAVLVVIRLRWPWLLTEPASVPRRRRCRRWREW